MRMGFVQDIEYEIVRKDGTTFSGLLSATAVYDSSGDIVMSRSTLINIDRRKLAELQLRNLTAHLQTVREEEKVAISREIHDDLGGTLTTLKMETHWLKSELPANRKTAPLLDHLETMSQLIDNATTTMRNIVTGLRPTMLDDLGLLAALEWQAEQFRKRTGIKCMINCIGNKGGLDNQHSIALFRISQEALTNVLRHSGASCVEIEYHHSDDEVVMSIIDNGRGMTKNNADASKCYGILGMRERVDQLGGSISFDIPPGGGFNVTVILPLLVDKAIEA
jgi:signal transduction histidine kinase